MKVKLAGFCLVVMALVICGAAAQATVLTFDDLVDYGGVPAGYGGIQWGANWEYYDSEQPPYAPKSIAQRVYNNFQLVPTFQFDTSSIFQGAWFAGRDFRTITFYMYDASNVLVASSGSITLSGIPTFLDSGYGGLVKRVDIGLGGSEPLNYFVMDDVTFNERAVPEPTTLLGFGLPMLMVGLGKLRGLRK